MIEGSQFRNKDKKREAKYAGKNIGKIQINVMEFSFRRASFPQHFKGAKKKVPQIQQSAVVPWGRVWSASA